MTQNFFAMENQSKMVERIFSLNIEPLCILDANGGFIKVNVSWENTFSYSNDELAHKKFVDFVHPNDLDDTFFKMFKMIDQDNALSFSNRYRSKDGTYRYLEWQFQHYGDLIYVAARDLTEKKALEAILQETKEHSKQEAITQSHILSIISQELNAPVTDILTALQDQEKMHLSDEQSALINRIHHSFNFLAHIINDISNISKIEASGLELEVTPFNLYSTVEDAIIPFTTGTNKINYSLDLFIQPETPESVMGDAIRLKQIITILVSNVIKSSNTGKISVNVSLKETFKSVYKIVVKVADTGTSLFSNDIDCLFKPFCKSSHLLSEKGRSANFELAIAKSLADEMHGKISFENEKDKGSVFLFSVLLKKDETDLGKTKTNYTLLNSKPIMNAAITSDVNLINSDKKQRVLIVDDSPLNTKILEQVLIENYYINIAHSGKDALAIANSDSPPDIILLDIMMPEMDGYEVCKELHLEQKTKDIPVIFLTALSNSENVEYGLKLGALDYITKPFSVPIVQAKIKNHLALKYYQDILRINTDVDQLTQIANRRRFDEMISIEIKKAKRTGTFLSVLMIDIDHFKMYNDTYGHLEGDECLRKVAFTLKMTLKRAGDLAARWGGEEFTCLLPDTDPRGAEIAAEKLRKTIMDLAIPHETSPVKKIVTVSIGVVTSIPSDDTSYEKLLKHADDALYLAKASGRNRVSSFTLKKEDCFADQT